MDDKRLIELWKGTTHPEPIIQQESLAKNAKNELMVFQQKIKKRNLRETIAAILVFVVFLWYAYSIPDWIVKGLSMAIALWAAWIVFVIRRAENKSPEMGTMTLLEYLSAYRNYLFLEMGLLKRVLYWYVLPPSLAAILFFIRTYEGSIWIELAYSIGVILFGIFVYYLNQRAIRHTHKPLLDKLNEWIKQFNQP